MSNEATNQIDVILVDDDDEVRSVMEMTADLMGYDVKAYGTSGSVIGQFAELNPKVTLIDLSLGSDPLDGITLGQKLRELPGGGETRMILMSGEVNGTIIAKADQAGFDEVVRKPLEMSKLAKYF